MRFFSKEEVGTVEPTEVSLELERTTPSTIHVKIYIKGYDSHKKLLKDAQRTLEEMTK
jgi:hypothetical protein